MRTRLAVAVGAVLVLSLAGCSGDPAAEGSPSASADPVVAAGEYCKDQVTATFDDESTVTFGAIAGGGSEESARYVFTTTASGDGQDFALTCTVTGEPGSFLLESYQLVAAG